MKKAVFALFTILLVSLVTFVLLPKNGKKPILLEPSEPNDEIVEKNHPSISVLGFEHRPNGINEIWGEVKNVNPDQVRIIILECNPKSEVFREAIICQPFDNGKWQAFGILHNSAELICLLMPYSYEKKIKSQNIDSYIKASFAHIVYNQQGRRCYSANRT